MPQFLLCPFQCSGNGNGKHLSLKDPGWAEILGCDSSGSMTDRTAVCCTRLPFTFEVARVSVGTELAIWLQSPAAHNRERLSLHFHALLKGALCFYHLLWRAVLQGAPVPRGVAERVPSECFWDLLLI